MELRDRLRNWALAHQWYRQRGRAFSLEGRFRPPRGVEVEYETGDPPPKAPEPIDIWDAWDVELAWRELPQRSRWCLKYQYHATVDGIKLTPEFACRLILKHAQITLRHQDWRDYLRIARKELADSLDTRRLNVALKRVQQMAMAA